MNELDPAFAKMRKIYLRKLIGGRARFHGVLYEIIEVLEDGPSLVLQDCEDHTTIQADQHGEAHRRVPQTITLSIPFTPAGDADPTAIGLELLDISLQEHNRLTG